MTLNSFNAFNLIGLDVMRLFRQMSKDNSRVGTHLARKYRDTLTNMCLWLAFISEVTWNVADGIQMMFMNNAGYVSLFACFRISCSFLDECTLTS